MDHSIKVTANTSFCFVCYKAQLQMLEVTPSDSISTDSQLDRILAGIINAKHDVNEDMALQATAEFVCHTFMDSRALGNCC